MVRLAVTPPPPRGPRSSHFTSQLALAHLHGGLVPLIELDGQVAIDTARTEGWSTLAQGRGFAGYGLTRALRMLLDVLDGLSALHDTQTTDGESFVHGEVVPALLRVDDTGHTRLVPLAPRHVEPEAALEQSRWGHLAPERLLGDALDSRADVYSAGVLLWEALAGRRLFESESVAGIITRLMGGKVTLPQLPPELGWATPLKAVASSALAVDPAQRFASVAELAEAIESSAGRYVAERADVAAFFSGTARPSLPTHNSSLSALVSPALAGSSEPPAPRESRPPDTGSKRRAWAIGALLSVLAGLSVTPVLRNAVRAASHPASPSASVHAPALAAAPLAPLPSATIAEPARQPAATPELAAAPEPAPTTKSKASKVAPKPSKALAAPKPKAPARPARIRDKEAEVYGI